MSRNHHAITREDLLSLDDYETIRVEKKQDALLSKKYRRLSLGPVATIMFENWDSMWLQIQEMLRIEKGGEEQIADELAAYNPMVPSGKDLTATLFFEINDPGQRATFLGNLGGVEDHIFLTIATGGNPKGEEIKIAAVPEGDVVRSREDGKASAVHFLHFPFSTEAVRAFKNSAMHDSGSVLVGIDHPSYGHMTMLSAETRRELAQDFL